MLQLTEAEFTDLIFQFGISRWGGTRKLPRASKGVFDAIRQLMAPPEKSRRTGRKS